MARLKKRTIKGKDDDYDNTLLSLTVFCQALWPEMSIWPALKKKYCNKVWNYLVKAQDWVA
jgi:hypothetical protein